jgi:hypothetical protein
VWVQMDDPRSRADAGAGVLGELVGGSWNAGVLGGRTRAVEGDLKQRRAQPPLFPPLGEPRTPGNRPVAGASVGAAQKAPLLPRAVLVASPNERLPQVQGAVGLGGVGSAAFAQEARLLAPRGRVAALPRRAAVPHSRLQSLACHSPSRYPTARESITEPPDSVRARRIPIGMEDLGPPASYLTLEEGTAVYASDGAGLGKVAHVLADLDADVFDGIVLDTSVLPGGHRFADAAQVARIHERGVVLAVDSTAAERLPEPSESPGQIEIGPDDVVPSDLSDKLRRAWDRISGKY